MKSVVVEASTVAKAIEIAWHKAEKPEEFFIRILQEHQVGFLGFGSQKAKIVFFFKNSQKSNSLFPVVVKQKEYTNFFGNHNLKVPTELDIVDTELNKNVALGTHKKKSHHHNQQKNKNNHHAVGKSSLDHHQMSDKNSALNNVVHNKSVQQKVGEKAGRHKDQERDIIAIKIQTQSDGLKSQAPQVENIQKQKNIAQKKELVKTHDVHQVHIKNVEQKPVAKKIQNVEQKDNVVKDIARALKKVQSQKIVANVSRQPLPKLTTATLPVNKLVDEKNVEQKTIEKQVTATSAPRIIQKLKRRPLSTENQGVSGITGSFQAGKVNNSDKKDSN